MKIGILTFHRAHNYGAVLQCFALQEVLKDMGHDVEIIDYRQPWIEGYYSLFYYKTFCRLYPGIFEKLRYIKNWNWRRNIVKNKSLAFTPFREKYFKLSKKNNKNISTLYDSYVIGSDQVWGPNCLGDKFDSIYLGYFKHSKKSRIIGYAISCDQKAIRRLESEYGLLKTLSNFYAISFREEKIATFVGEQTNRKVSVTLDPTLLTNVGIWERVINYKWNSKKFVAIYQIRTTEQSTHILYNNALNYIKSCPECEIIDLSDMKYSVSDFVSIIKNARCVFTTSFHAIVFSLILHTPFYAFKLHDGHDDRYVSLLETLGLQDRISDLINLSEFDNKKIDFKSTDSLLQKLQKCSFDFLNMALNS